MQMFAFFLQAKTDKLKQIPPYSVGLGKLTSNSVEVKESSIDDSNFIIHKELRELQECLKVFLEDFVIPRSGYDNSVENKLFFP